MPNLYPPTVPKKSSKRLIFIILGIAGGLAIIIFVGPALLLISALFAISASNANPTGTCATERRAIATKADTALAQMNAINFMPNHPDVNGVINKSGDCVDSNPDAQLSKSYQINETGAAALQEINASMTTHGFTSNGPVTYAVKSCNNGSLKMYTASTEYAMQTKLYSIYFYPPGSTTNSDCYDNATATAQQFATQSIEQVLVSTKP